jgi:hypothetical protein
VLAPLLLEWTNRSVQAGAAARPARGATPLLPAGPWGSSDKPMADVSPQLKGAS